MITEEWWCHHVGGGALGTGSLKDFFTFRVGSVSFLEQKMRENTLF